MKTRLEADRFLFVSPRVVLRTPLVAQMAKKERKKESEVAQFCLSLCDLMVCSLPRSSVHGIFQAGVLEWVAISFSRESSRPRVQTHLPQGLKENLMNPFALRHPNY